MTTLTARILEMLIRVRQFGLSHPAGFPAGSRGRELLDLVDEYIDTIEELLATYEQHARAAKEKTSVKQAAVAALRKLMTSISRTARSMARNTPGIENKFQMPGGETVQELLAAGRSFLTEAEPLKDEFIRRGLAPNFVDDLRGRIMLLDQTVDQQAQKSAARVAANASLTATARSARQTVRELDATVRNVFAADEATLAEWESASHIERASRRAEVNAPAPAGV